MKKVILLGCLAFATMVSGCASSYGEPSSGKTSNETEYYSVTSTSGPEDVISGALGYYCQTAPTNPQMWLPYGSSGIFSAMVTSTGEFFTVRLQPGVTPSTTELRANDDGAAARFAEWGCPTIMVVQVN